MSKAADPKLPDERMLKLEYVAWLLDCSRRTVQKMVAEGKFPRAIYITESDIRIPEESYRQFIQERTVNYRPLST